MPQPPPSQSARKPRRKPRTAEEDKPLFRLETHIFYLFSGILAARNRMLNAKLATHDLDYPRWRVLAVLSEHPGASMLKLAELTSVDRTTLTHTVRVMVEEDLIGRRERGTDRRSVELTLTRHGTAKFKRILPAVLELNEQALSGLKAHEVDMLRALLGRVVDNLKA